MYWIVSGISYPLTLSQRILGGLDRAQVAIGSEMVLIGVIIFFKNLLSSSRKLQPQIEVVFQEDFIFVAQFSNFGVEQYFLGDVESIIAILGSSSKNCQFDSRKDLFDAHPEGSQNLPDVHLGKEPFLRRTQHFIEDVIELLLRRKPYFGDAVFVLFLNEALEVLFNVFEILHEILALLINEEQFR